MEITNSYLRLTNGDNEMTMTDSSPVDQMLAVLPVIDFDPELLAVGSEPTVSLKAKRVAESIQRVAEALADHFAEVADKHAYPIHLQGISLEPDDRKDVRVWLNAKIPLADEAYTWDVQYDGRPDAFNLVIKKRITRTRR